MDVSIIMKNFNDFLISNSVVILFLVFVLFLVLTTTSKIIKATDDNRIAGSGPLVRKSWHWDED